MELSRALRTSSPGTIAFTGAGGKTTALFQLARQLPPPVVVTATSHLGQWQGALADVQLIASSPADLPKDPFSGGAVLLVTGQASEERLQPVSDELILWLHASCEERGLYLLVEADGSRQKQLKAPAAHEPATPPFAEIVVHVAGLHGLGQPLNAETVHRPEVFGRLSGLSPGAPIDLQALEHVLLHREGGLKNIPPAARRLALFTQADTPELQALGGQLARRLLPAFDAALVSDLNQANVHSVHERIAGIVLAAGGSARFGRPKQLLDWRGQPFVRAVARTALSAGLSPVIVVLGAESAQIEPALNDLPVTIVPNDDWQEGQAASIRHAIEALTAIPRAGIGAAVFLLVDQPQVTPAILEALIAGHAHGLPAILAPMVNDRRANPVLFDRSTFDDLLQLKGDVGGRAVFSEHRVQYLPWHDDRLLLDVDTPEQYARLVADETL